MATTITSASLTISISEAITLNNQTVNSDNQQIITGINEVDKRIVTIPISAEITLFLFGTAAAAGQLIRSDIKYLRISNKDDTNFVRIRVKKTGADTFDIRLDAGKSFMLGNTKESVSASAGAFSAFVDIDSISAQADTAAVDVELFAASI